MKDIFTGRALTHWQRSRGIFLAFLMIILMMALALRTGGGWWEQVTMGYAWSFLLAGYVLGCLAMYMAAEAHMRKDWEWYEEPEERSGSTPPPTTPTTGGITIPFEPTSGMITVGTVLETEEKDKEDEQDKL